MDINRFPEIAKAVGAQRGGKYLKRIPKPGGGYKYVYHKEHARSIAKRGVWHPAFTGTKDHEPIHGFQHMAKDRFDRLEPPAPGKIKNEHVHEYTHKKSGTSVHYGKDNRGNHWVHVTTPEGTHSTSKESSMANAKKQAWNLKGHIRAEGGREGIRIYGGGIWPECYAARQEVQGTWQS